jgi:rare lipoprotein A
VANSKNACFAAFLTLLFTLSACVSNPPDSAPRSPATNIPDDAVPRQEAKSRYGNGPDYQVFGEDYRVLDSSSGYKEQGVASWYGKKFHGRKTSNQETYDMYAMTAAHKSLPLPTYVRVRNLRNNKSVVVRVNDRGPFVDNRLIDLSYSAALKLDMIRDGTSLVEVTAINFEQPPAKPAETIRVQSIEKKAYTDPAPSNDVFVQVGAFGERENAQRRYVLLRNRGFRQAFVHEDKERSPSLYRVRIGPITDATQYDVIVEELQQLGISETHLVTD